MNGYQHQVSQPIIFKRGAAYLGGSARQEIA